MCVYNVMCVYGLVLVLSYPILTFSPAGKGRRDGGLGNTGRSFTPSVFPSPWCVFVTCSGMFLRFFPPCNVAWGVSVLFSACATCNVCSRARRIAGLGYEGSIKW